MGLRYRKSTSRGPFRVTASKSGLSASVGVPGFRLTKTSGGATRATVSAPGTGVSFSTQTGGGSGSASPSGKGSLSGKGPNRWDSKFGKFVKVMGIFTAVLCVLTFLLIRWANSGKPAEEPARAAVTATAAPTPTPTPAPTATEKPEPTPAPVLTYVVNTNSGVVHVPSCQHAKKISDANRQEIQCTREEMLAMGYELCGTCTP